MFSVLSMSRIEKKNMHSNVGEVWLGKKRGRGGRYIVGLREKMKERIKGGKTQHRWYNFSLCDFIHIIHHTYIYIKNEIDTFLKKTTAATRDRDGKCRDNLFFLCSGISTMYEKNGKEGNWEFGWKSEGCERPLLPMLYPQIPIGFLYSLGGFMIRSLNPCNQLGSRTNIFRVKSLDISAGGLGLCSVAASWRFWRWGEVRGEGGGWRQVTLFFYLFRLQEWREILVWPREEFRTRGGVE